MASERKGEDQRRFKMWFRINDNDPIEISDLKTSTYVRLKKFDNEFYKFVSNMETNRKEKIKFLWKSIDDIDYTPVEVPTESSAIVCSQIPTESSTNVFSNTFSRANDSLICKHCKEMIESFDVVPQHRCFIGKDVFMDANQTLFKIEDADNNQCYMISEDNPLENEMMLSEKNDTKKSNAVWNKHSTLAVLSLYEANLHMLDNPKKKTKVWTAISDGLKQFDVEMSSDQVRWKINTLIKKYKECVDNNAKSGRNPISFEYYDQMEEIFGKDKEAFSINGYTRSSNLPKKTTINPVLKTKTIEIQSEVPVVAECHPSVLKARIPQINNPKASMNEKRARPLHGTGSNNAKAKLQLEKQWLEHLQSEKNRQIQRDVRLTKLLEKKTEAVNLKKRQLQMQEKELEVKKMIASNKLKAKYRQHDEIIAIEREKCKLLHRLLKDKENIEQSVVNSVSDSDAYDDCNESTEN
ncbi:PREDICTED: uncharacterized protein LOC108771121 [Trachymyrmex cornetzi]|uniref:Myb/SANT-like DNA-binding domain-containing protein n=1 Tax=Trachymyrmex cornetzi TaxID=471704 RepID=A0A151ITV1_9HYME|nr:PREDICTED: uncharacterized protein LOC108758540 [Trachymyrmex cornetzi]XP_018368338.1 PREDICTED: uncharacterized protein LOC108764554 [Trachymyrmex cornetzi]XP_018374681.1 PREDICTED: uncharacterized protein LOC108768658 [Trachymyrmex cornetzi]XP_018378532.1 PREDICTED: uncharacterized protein LOC108771121 [Trachymyrmex cornetzi]KYN10866.1 hypothetical protein ALC57_16993 [Trachymyrmex cornetzi]KYN15952.1 hypothetical protein ALC57_11812 [Trachymyrmex cornetzi]KYN27623.1 hypothetical protein